MTVSLKSTLPTLGRLLGETAITLYERQLALMREGLLESRGGRGPGTGVPATPESIALVVIALIVRLTHSDVGPATRAIALAKATSGKCAFTGAATFKDALARLLMGQIVSPTDFGRLETINIDVIEGTAKIISNTKSPLVPDGATVMAGRLVSGFSGKKTPASLQVEIGIKSDTIKALSDYVVDLFKDVESAK